MSTQSTNNAADLAAAATSAATTTIWEQLHEESPTRELFHEAQTSIEAARLIALKFEEDMDEGIYPNGDDRMTLTDVISIALDRFKELRAELQSRLSQIPQ